MTVDQFVRVFGKENDTSKDSPALLAVLRKRALKRAPASFLGSRLASKNLARGLGQLSEPARVSLWPPRYAVLKKSSGNVLFRSGEDSTKDAVTEKIPMSAALIERAHVMASHESTTEWLQLPTDKMGPGATVLFNPFTCEYVLHIVVLPCALAFFLVVWFF